MPWEKKYNEPDVLDRAMRAFWSRGYEATSMSDLVAATGINRGSIYSAFNDKRGLFLKALKHYDRAHRADFLDRLAQTHSPRDAILQAFAAAAQRESDHPPGCLLVNTALELSPHDPEVAAMVQSSLDQVKLFFCAMLRAARRAGTIPADVSVEEKGAALLSLFLGLRVMARAGMNDEGTQAVLDQAEAMLG